MGERNVTSNVEVVGSTPTAFTNKENYTMRSACLQCQRILFLDDFYEIVYNEDGLHLLCSKECKDKWDEISSTRLEKSA